MKLEIDLDLSKIDYEAINKQIADKVAALDIEDMYDMKSKIDNVITNMIKTEVDDSYNEYIDKYWRDPTAKGRSLVESMSKAEIENRTKQVIEDVFANTYNENAMREIMLKIIPDVFAAILFSRMESALFTKEYNYYDQVHSMVKAEIDYAIHSMRVEI